MFASNLPLRSLGNILSQDGFWNNRHISSTLASSTSGAGFTLALTGRTTPPSSNTSPFCAQHGRTFTRLCGSPRLAQCVLGSPSAANLSFRSCANSLRRPVGSQHTGCARRGPPDQ